MNNSDLIKKFYSSFASSDAQSMAQCYNDDILFSDPAFGNLKGNEVRQMWHMLIRNAKGNLKIGFSDVEADENSGAANWIAEYVFSKTGRRVVNRIHARFEFRNGKISRHTDNFDLWKWSMQALGWKGYLLGWTPWMKKKIQRQTRKLLQDYSAKMMSVKDQNDL